LTALAAQKVAAPIMPASIAPPLNWLLMMEKTTIPVNIISSLKKILMVNLKFFMVLLSQNIRPLIDKGISVRYSYFDKDRSFIISTQIIKSDCH
jgi:hypothetical protein